MTLKFKLDNTSSRKLRWLFALYTASGIGLGLAGPAAIAQIEETRLAQPILQPVPDDEEDDENDDGESADEVPEDRAAILGMTIEEASRNRAIVTDVAVNSPAEGSGIKKGDYVVALNGLKIDAYDKWLEGVQRIIRDTPDGTTVQLSIERNGRRAMLPIRTLVSTATAPPARPSGGQPGQPIGPGIVPPPPAVGQAAARFPGGDGDIFVANQDFFGDIASGRPNERAIAHLYLLAGAVQELAPQPHAEPVDPETDIAGALSASASDKRDSSAGGFGAEGRIGLAGFRNRDQGMLVMVDAGMLPPGNYTVGIADPSSIAGELGNPSPETPQNPVADPNRPNAQGASSASESEQPSSGQPGRLDTPQQQRLQEPLRQVLNEGAAGGEATPGAAKVEQPAAPLTRGLGAPPGATDVGVSSGTTPRAASPNSAASGMLAQIGMLTVDQSGTGRMQDIVEGIQVADVIGQAVVIYANTGVPTTTIPPGGNTVDSANPAQNGHQNREVGIPSGKTYDLAGPMPIAAGLIEIVSPRGIEGQSTENPNQSGPPASGSSGQNKTGDALPPPQ